MSQNNQRSQRGNSSRRGGGSGSRPGRKSSAPAGPAPEPLKPTENPPDIESFAEFDLHPLVQEAIAAMGIVKPTPIQALAIGPVLKGKDVIAKAETGTGKTLAFGAPMISMIDPQRSSVLGLVLAPTRELADQVKVVLEQLGEARGIKVALIVGGEPAGPQVAALQAGAQVVVGTPGRVIDLYEQKFLSFPWTEFVVLDEADEMFEIGFVDDVKKIMKFTPEERQTLLFSATFPPALLRLARDATKEPAEISTASGVKTVDNIEQVYIRLGSDERPLALIRMIERSEPEDVFLIFCERRTDVERLMRRLERLPFSVKALHGGYDQSARFRVMSAFRSGEVKALVATDVASRGLDVNHVTRVVNFSPPRSITDYTHRIGRTGRAGREGHAVTLVAPEGNVRWNSLMRDATWEIPEVEAPGSRFNSAPRKVERDDRDDRDDRDAQEERPRRPRREERERPQRSERSTREVEAEEPVATEAAPVRQPLRRPQSTDAPVELPSKVPVRQRDPNDPPRRARLPRERFDTEEDRPKRADRDEGRERSRSRSRSEREERPRPSADRDSERPQRDRSRSRQERDEAPRERDDRNDGDEPRRERSRSRSRGEREERPRQSADRDSERPQRDRSRSRQERDETPRDRDDSNAGDEPRRDRSRSRSRGEREERPRDTQERDSERPRRSRASRDEEAAPRERTPSRVDREAAPRSNSDERQVSEKPRRERTRSRQEPTDSPTEPTPKKKERAERPAPGGGFGSGL